MNNKRNVEDQYILCQYCTHNFGKANAIGRLRMTCPDCGTDLDVYVGKYSVKVERHKEAS